jgi:WNK lysine deficient protein kinase
MSKDNCTHKETEYTPLDDGSTSGNKPEIFDKIPAQDTALQRTIRTDSRESESPDRLSSLMDKNIVNTPEAMQSTTAVHTPEHSLSNNLDKSSRIANNATSTSDSCQSTSTKNPDNSSDTTCRVDDTMKGDSISTNKDNQDEAVRSGPSAPGISYSLSVDSSSSVGLNEYIRSPEVQNAIVERSPGGRYVRFMEKLGSGASKDVFRAYDTQEGIEVAWNVVSLTGVPKQERNRIVNEVRLLERLHHQNIISFHGSWVNRERQEVNFVTEILSSGTLKSFIKKVQVIRWKIAKRWAFQILNGLDYLHSQDPPVIHRDLKCENIFINGTSGDLRIGDLGLSTVHRNGKVLSVLGTPEFMAPDMYEETSYDEKVDVYAFGMCLLEIFTKEIPYAECKNPAQIYKKVSSGEPPEVLSRLQSKHARDFVVLCLGFKNDEGKYIRPSVAELLQHPFLLKRPTDDDEVVVDPPFRERTISEVPENSSEQMSQQQSRVQQSAEPSASQTGLVSIVQAKKRSASIDSIEDTEGDTFDNMQESEIVMNKVKVLMGRGQELEEVEQIKEETSQLPVTETYPNTSLEDGDPQTKAVVHRDLASNEPHSLLCQNVDIQQHHVTKSVPGLVQGSYENESPQPPPVSSLQHLLPPTNPQQQLGQNQISPGKMTSNEIQPQMLNPVNQLLKFDSKMQHQGAPEINVNVPVPMQSTQHHVVRDLNPNTHHHVISDVNISNPQMQSTQHQVMRDANSNIAAAPQSSYLVAAAVFEQENPNIRPYADDILELVVTLPVDGQTQFVQFKFHLVEDDPVQVAKEMVEDLGIPHGAILEISETISGLARNARMKQEKYTNRSQQNTNGQMHQQFTTTVLHPNQHAMGQTTNLDQTTFQQQTLNSNVQQMQTQPINLNGRSQEKANYQMNSNQPAPRITMANGNSTASESFAIQNSQNMSHAIVEQGTAHTSMIPQDFTSYSGDTSNTNIYVHQQTQRKSIGSAVEHPMHHTRSHSMQQQLPVLSQNGNTAEQYVQQGAPQFAAQGGASASMEPGNSYQQTSNDLKFYPSNIVLQQSNNGQQHLSSISSLSSGVPQYHYQSAVNVFSPVVTDQLPPGASKAGTFEKVDQVQAISSDPVQSNMSHPFSVNVDEVKNNATKNGLYSQHVAAGELMSTGNVSLRLPQFRDITHGTTQVGVYNQSAHSVEIGVPNKSIITSQQNFNLQQAVPLSHGDSGSGTVSQTVLEAPSYLIAASNATALSAAQQITPIASVNSIVNTNYSQLLPAAPVAEKLEVLVDTFNRQKQSEIESVGDTSVYSQQESLSVNDTRQPVYPGALSIEPVASDQQVGNDSLLSVDDCDDISDDEINDEVRKLEEEFQRNLQRANKVFINRMDNLQRSQIEREAQHQKTLERHQKEQAEYEKRRAQEEEQQNRRIEQLQREWGKKKESIVLSKRKNQQKKSINDGIHVQISDTGTATTTSSESVQELTSGTDYQPEGTTSY